MEIEETLREAQAVKGYSLELDDARHIIGSIEEELTTLPIDTPGRQWAHQTMKNMLGKCGVIWDPDNIHYIYQQMDKEVPNWYMDKYPRVAK